MSTMVATQPEATPKTEVTPEELLAMPDGGHYELIDGELKERRVSALSNFVASEISRHSAKPLPRARLGLDFRSRARISLLSLGSQRKCVVPMSPSSAATGIHCSS